MEPMALSHIATQLSRFETVSGEALAAVRADTAASPVLAAVVGEFNRKAQKAVGALAASPDERTAREAVVEVEQAADSANYAAAADTGAAESTKEAVYAAHIMVCVFKQAMLTAGVRTAP